MNKKLVLIIALISTLLPTTSCSSTCKHDWLYTDNGDGTHLAVCSKDCSHKKTEPHNFNDGTITLNPTEFTPGRIEFKCKNCKYTYSEALPPTKEHVYDQEIVDNKYLYKELSSKSKIYYKSSKDGAYGNINYLFERSPFIDDERLKDYTEIEYISSGEDSFIDTGIKVNGETRIKTKAYAGEGGYSIFGGSVDDHYDLAIMNLVFGDHNGDGLNEGKFYYKSYSNGSPYSIDLAYKTHVFDFNRNKAYVDGKLYHSFDEEIVVPDISNLYLFARNSGTGVAHDLGVGIRIYNCEIYQGDNLVRDFIPVYRNSDKKLGMFDFKEYKFYPMISNANEKDKSYYHNEYRQNELPSGYKQVLYIENDAMNRIDTGLIVNGSDNASYSGIMQANDNVNHWIGANYWLEWPASFFPDITEPHYIETKNLNFTKLNYLDDKVKNISPHAVYIQEYKNVKVGVFALGNKNEQWCNDTDFVSMRLYSLKININGKLKRDFIPCLKEDDNTPGLYDVVENKFYQAENVGGTTAPLKYEEQWKDIPVLGKGRIAPIGGDINCHYIDKGKIVKEPTISEKGTIEYTCQICQHKFEDEIDSKAYQVDFVHPESANISILKDYDPSTGVIADIGYTRNKTSYNYSKDDATIIFKINSSNLYDIDNIRIDGNYKSLNKLGDNFFQIEGIISNTKVNIIDK